MNLTCVALTGTFVQHRFWFALTGYFYHDLAIQFNTETERGVSIMSKASGNLVQNGSFELGLLAWQYENVLSAKGNSHTGTYRAVLGGEGEQQSALFQNIKISHNRCYILSLFACSEESSGDLHIKLIWLDKKGADIGAGISFDVPSSNLSTFPIWTYFVELSGKSPDDARYARLSITKDPGGCVSLDDIILYQQKA